MKALIVGSGRQLGRAPQAAAPAAAAVTALGRGELDLSDEGAVSSTIAAIAPDIVFNAAAYIAVDKAESGRAQAFAINDASVGFLVRATHVVGGRLVHVSTDFDFDGTSRIPYKISSAPAPLGVYGHSKLAGEQSAG